MEPPKPSQLNKAADAGLEADHAEYESLLSARFSRDPSLAADAVLAGVELDAHRARESRLEELGQKLIDAGVLPRPAP